MATNLVNGHGFAKEFQQYTDNEDETMGSIRNNEIGQYSMGMPAAFALNPKYPAVT